MNQYFSSLLPSSRKLSLLLLIFLVGALTAQAQTSPAQAQLNMLKSSMRSLEKLAAAPKWETSSYRSRFKTYLEKAEKNVQKAQSLEPGIEIPQQARVSELRALYDANGGKIEAEEKAAAEAKRAAYAEKHAQEKAESDAWRKERDQQLAEKQRQFEADQNAQRASEAEEREAKAARNAAQDKELEAKRAQWAKDNAEREKIEQERIAAGLPVQDRPKGWLLVTLKSSCGTKDYQAFSEQNGRATIFHMSGNGSKVLYLAPGTKVGLAPGGKKGPAIATISKEGQTVWLCH